MVRFWSILLPMISLGTAIATGGFIVVNSERAIATPYSNSPQARRSELEQPLIPALNASSRPILIEEQLIEERLDIFSSPSTPVPSVWQLAADSPTNTPAARSIYSAVIDDVATVEHIPADATASNDIRVDTATIDTATLDATTAVTFNPLDISTTNPYIPGSQLATNQSSLVSELALESALELALEAESEDATPSIPLNGDGITDDGITDDGAIPADTPSTDTPSSIDPEITPEIDPELGILRLRPLADSNPTAIDPELGILRLRPIAPPRPRRRPISVAGRMSFFSGNNLLARSEPEADDIFQVGLSLRAVPKIGPRTFLISTAEVSTLRYAENDDFNYNQLDFRLGVYHYFTRRIYTDLHWRNQQFFRVDGGDRFLDNHQLRWTLGRIDQLNPNLELNSAYQLQMRWADPADRSYLSNRFQIGLTQDFTPDVQAGLSYQFVLNDYTRQDRNDTYHQLLAQLRYDFSDTTSLAVFGGGRWGNSSNALIDFDTALFGVTFTVNVPLF